LKTARLDAAALMARWEVLQAKEGSSSV
jgi:hypothetical protein